jgi:hypothetical protein
MKNFPLLVPEGKIGFKKEHGMLKKTLNILVIMMIGFLSLGINASVQAETTFDDVYYDHWAYDDIERLFNAGVTSGCSLSPLRYCPDQYVTRAQIAKIILSAHHFDEEYSPLALKEGDMTGFEDVAWNHWAAAWIKEFAKEGLTKGCGNGNYCPDSYVTRAQMAYFLLRAKYENPQYEPPSVGNVTGFNDVKPDDFAAAWIKQLAVEGITNGCGGGNYCPDDPVSRAQMAVFVVKTFNLPELPSIPMATVYVQNNTGGELCYEAYDTGIGQQCFGAGEHLYGIFPSGAYDYTVFARCGRLSDRYTVDDEVVHKFWCNPKP